MWYRGLAECWQVHAVQLLVERKGAGGEFSVLHD